MNRREQITRLLILPAASLLLALAVLGCKGNFGGGDPILGGDGSARLAPWITSVSPPHASRNVPITTTTIRATFNEPMAPLGGAATFTVTCAAPASNPTGTVSFDATNQIVTFTLAPATILAPSTLYTAVITGAKSQTTGLAMMGAYTWSFTTAGVPDTTRPRVTLTAPVTTTPGPTLAVPANTAITAVFTEAMAPTTINAASFTVTAAAPGVSPAGSVTYVAGSNTAVFTPTAALAVGTTYTATITIAATDLAGNALAGNQAALPAASAYVWSFTTAAPDLIAPTVTLTYPVNLATPMAINSAISATFSEAMNPTTISTSTFTVQVSGPPLGSVLAGAVLYDPLTHVATFTPSSNLAPSTAYTATISIGAKDMAGNTRVAGLVPNPWTFTTGSALAPGALPLGSAAGFGIMATSAITNTGAATIINGDVSLDPGTSCGLLPIQVNGAIHINDTVSAQARADLLIAYNFAKALPPGTTIAGGADLGALYPLGIPPGTYTSGSTMLVSTPLTLDAGGNANAVWVFQIGSSFTSTASVSLANGAQAKNVFWVPTADATIGVGSIFYGTIVSGRSVTGVTGAVINGRILAGAITGGTIALDTNTVNVPAL